jgi:hypothetical protein
MPRWHTRLCTASGRDAVQALYAPSKARGIQRNLAQTMETVEICVRNRSAQTAGSPRVGP